MPFFLAKLKRTSKNSRLVKNVLIDMGVAVGQELVEVLKSRPAQHDPTFTRLSDSLWFTEHQMNAEE